jgi:drug/metabolite transporter (DMT)-like permease
MDPSAASLARGRACILLAAVLWSFSGAFTKVLREETVFGLNDPLLAPKDIACVRSLIAGLVLLVVIKPRHVTFHPLMLVMAGCFAAMNILFVSAMSYGSAASAILLQYTAPMWTVIGCVWWLKEPVDRRSLITVLIGLCGVAVLIAGAWKEAQLDVIAMGLGSGFSYAGVLICLRVLRDRSPAWLTVQNFLVSGVVLIPFVLPLDVRPTFGQWIVLFLYGAVQMGVPYMLMTHALRTVSPQEAGTITLLEPLLNPVWAYLVVRETPSPWTFAGGVFIIGALAWRYWPRSRSRVGSSTG